MWNWAHFDHQWISCYFTINDPDDNGDGVKFIIKLCKYDFCDTTDVTCSEMHNEGNTDNSRENVPALIAKGHIRNVANKEALLERGEYIKHWNTFKLPNAVKETVFCTECGDKA